MTAGKDGILGPTQNGDMLVRLEVKTEVLKTSYIWKVAIKCTKVRKFGQKFVYLCINYQITY